MLLFLRLALYVQLLLGLGRFAGLIPQQQIWEIHIGLGVIIAVVALIVLRPIPRSRLLDPGPRSAARWFPLLTLAVGLAMYFGYIGGRTIVMIHMLLGIITIGLVEVAAARQRRAGRGYI